MFGWLFRRKASSGALEERLEKVERGLAALNDDWGEFHDKVSRQVWRNAKRVAASPTEDADADGTPEPPGAAPRPVSRPLGMDPISAKIRARRGTRVVRFNGEG